MLLFVPLKREGRDALVGEGLRHVAHGNVIGREGEHRQPWTLPFARWRRAAAPRAGPAPRDTMTMVHGLTCVKRRATFGRYLWDCVTVVGRLRLNAAAIGARLPRAEVFVLSMRRFLIGAAALILLCGLVAYRYQDVLIPWIEGGSDPGTIVVSGNIEAHESVISFKTIQSRIVELPFDEGQTVKAGTVIARVDDADYKQQVAIAEAALNAQTRQLDVAQQNVVAARRTIVSDEADVALKQLEFDRAQT